MADVMRYRWGPKAEVAIKKTGTIAISIGDIVKVGTNGRCLRVTGPNNATAAVGIAMSASPTTDPTATVIRVLQFGFGTVFEMVSADADTAFEVGQQFLLTAAQPQQLTKYGTAGTNPLTSASNVVATLVEELDSSGSAIKVQFRPSRWNNPIKRGS